MPKLSTLILVLLIKDVISSQTIKTSQISGKCSYPEELEDLQISKIKVGDWYPYGLSKIRDEYLSPFFNPFGTLNCLKIEIKYNFMFQCLHFEYKCNTNETDEITNCFKYEFGLSHQNQFQYIGDSYDCHPDLKMMNITIIGTDYSNFIILFGCNEKDSEHTNGIYVLISSYMIPKTVENNIFKILNKIQQPVNDSSYFEILKKSNKIENCDCSLECKYKVCFGNYSSVDFINDNFGVGYVVWDGTNSTNIQIEIYLSETELYFIGIGFTFLLMSNLALMCLMNSFNVEVYLKNSK